MPIQKITETETSSSPSPDTHFLVTQPEANEAGKLVESLRRIGADDIADMLKKKFGLGDTAKELASLKEDIDKLDSRLSESIFDTLADSPNLFNKYDNRNIHGYFSGTTIILNDFYTLSHPILLKGGSVYKFKFPTELGTNNRYIQCDEDGNYLDWYNFNVGTDGFVTINPSADRYVRINIGTIENADNFVFSKENVYPKNYIGYGKYITENDMKSSNPLFGKKAVFTGDSICYGEGATGGYARLIGLNNDMKIQNVGVSGGTIVNTSGIFCISESIASLDSNADYVILEGGVNDASLALPLGTITNNYWRTFDTTTFCGAFEKMLKDTWEKFPTQKKGYVMVHKCTAGFSSDTGTGSNGIYYDAVLKICLKWAIPVLDMQEHCPPMAFWGASDYPNLRTIKNAYTKNGDGWHPNEDGYKKYYVPAIEAWMKTL